MRSGHLGPWLALTVLCAALAVTNVHAQAPVVCAGLEDSELLARIRGQTRDLPISLSAAPAELNRPSVAEMQAIAREHAAEFVVSVDQEPNGSRTVYVFDARAGELRVRSAPAPDRKARFARSAAAETVALIVRGELSDALAARASQEAARVEENASRTPTAPGAASAEKDVAARPVAQATGTKPGSRSASKGSQPSGREDVHEDEDARAHGDLDEDSRANGGLDEDSRANADLDEVEGDATGSFSLGPARFSVELAARGSTSIDERYFFGAALSLRVSFDFFSVGVTGSTTLPDRADIQGLSLTLREHGVGVDLLARLPLTAAVELGLGGAGRFLFLRRSAESGDPEWMPERASTRSTFAVGPQAELRWQVVQYFGVSVRFGLDVLLRPVSWRYQLDTNPSGPIELERQNRTEPWLSVGVFGSL